MRPMLSRAALAAAVLSLPLYAAPADLGAQQRDSRTDAERRDAERRASEREARIERLPGGFSISYGLSDRPVLGVSLAESTRGDTAGVRIESVTPDGPAARAGLKAGDVITAINGVNLRVSESDAADPALQGLAQRRLQRTLSRAKAGDNVELRVRSGGGSRTVDVKTVTASELSGVGRTAAGSGSGQARTTVNSAANRGALGISIGGSGSARDTLGLFVSSVVAGGPAEKAGIVEGARIASVNGVDVRVPREDVDDPGATSARTNRFTREVAKVAPGSSVTLRVYEGGRYRDVSVTAVRASELPNRGFRMSIGDGGTFFDLPEGAIFRSPNVRTLPFDGDMPRIRLRGLDGELNFDREAFRRSMDELRRNLQEGGRTLRELRIDGSERPVIVRTYPRQTLTRIER